MIHTHEEFVAARKQLLLWESEVRAAKARGLNDQAMLVAKLGEQLGREMESYRKHITPSVGRIVHLRGAGDTVSPAIVTCVFEGDNEFGEPWTVALTVLLVDGVRTGVLAEYGTLKDQWHWPPS